MTDSNAADGQAGNRAEDGQAGHGHPERSNIDRFRVLQADRSGLDGGRAQYVPRVGGVIVAVGDPAYPPPGLGDAGRN